MNITPEDVQALREFSGEGLMACASALIRSEGDIRLAYGYLKSVGCLIHTEDRVHGVLDSNSHATYPTVWKNAILLNMGWTE